MRAEFVCLFLLLSITLNDRSKPDEHVWPANNCMNKRAKSKSWRNPGGKVNCHIQWSFIILLQHMSAETALDLIQNILGKCSAADSFLALKSPGNWGATQLKVITSDHFLCSLDCLWDSQPLKWEIWDLYIKCLFKTLYKWGNVIELEPQWGWADFSGTALILHQMKPSLCSAAGKLHLREGGRMGLGSTSRGYLWCL